MVVLQSEQVVEVAEVVHTKVWVKVPPLLLEVQVVVETELTIIRVLQQQVHLIQVAVVVVVPIGLKLPASEVQV
jgi:hypothetical protein